MTYQASLRAAHTHLLQARDELGAEVSAYPTPVSGCDAQFNHLLSDRQKIANALAALEAQPFVATPRIVEPGARVESR